MSNDAIDVKSTEADDGNGEPGEEPTVASLAPAVRASTSLVEPAASSEVTLKAFHAYNKLCDDLLVREDYQQIGGRSFRKKSAWRKLAVAFGVSCELVDRDHERGPDGRIVRTEVVVRATAPNGRYMDGLGACDLYERCCSNPCTVRAQNHRHCPASQGEQCTVAHFSHSQHDIPATAHTRATNRACADLFGFGEVSAEEVHDGGSDQGPPVSAGAGPADGDDAFITNEQYERIRTLVSGLPEDVRKQSAGQGTVLGVQIVEGEERLIVMRQSQYQPIIDRLEALHKEAGEKQQDRPPVRQEDAEVDPSQVPCSKCGSTRSKRVLHDGAVVCSDVKGCGDRAENRQRDAEGEADPDVPANATTEPEKAADELLCGGNTGKGCGEVVEGATAVYDDAQQPFHPACADFL